MLKLDKNNKQNIDNNRMAGSNRDLLFKKKTLHSKTVHDNSIF